ncbi:hypothetical protein JMN32_17975 [Fulvivirga sp. 29W222]|uniref:Uncharacterized protein n=1 Tax=Fulvivirga marina TaxID=2494733 RepID=A0A937G177_9BACT|nr:hypothetical protein [Fulvivirga marina]MBL6448208.1 hypothetical protein [Fulvivirga marina]
MKSFYIETDQLTQVRRTLRYVFNEKEDGEVSFVKVVDPVTEEEVTLEEMKRETSPDTLLNITTAYKANYKRVYF